MSDIDLKALREKIRVELVLAKRGAWVAAAPVNLSEVACLLDRLESAERRAEEAEKEASEQARLVGMGAERELALMAKLNSASEMAAKHGEVLQLVGSALGMEAGSSLNKGLIPVLHELVKDAERYWWIRDEGSQEASVVCHGGEEGIWLKDGEWLDESVDTAMAQNAGVEDASENASSGVDSGVNGGAEVAQEGGK